MFILFSVSQGSITFVWFVFSVSSQARFFLAIFPDAVKTIIDIAKIFLTIPLRVTIQRSTKVATLSWVKENMTIQKPTKSAILLQFSKRAAIPQTKYQKSTNSVAFLYTNAKRDYPISHKKGHHIASQRQVTQTLTIQRSTTVATLLWVEEELDLTHNWFPLSQTQIGITHNSGCYHQNLKSLTRRNKGTKITYTVTRPHAKNVKT